MSDWDQRELCPDGGCIGVIGDNGTCNVCGKRGVAPVVSTPPAEAASEAEPRNTDFDEDDEYYYEDEDASDDDGSDGDGNDHEAPQAPGWTDRKLCPDGGCVGVIGDNGMCKVCGRKGE